LYECLDCAFFCLICLCGKVFFLVIQPRSVFTVTFKLLLVVWMKCDEIFMRCWSQLWNVREVQSRGGICHLLADKQMDKLQSYPHVSCLELSVFMLEEWRFILLLLFCFNCVVLYWVLCCFALILLFYVLFCCVVYCLIFYCNCGICFVNTYDLSLSLKTSYIVNK